MFESFRASLALRALRSWLHAAKRTRAVHNFTTAHTIGLLFDASNEKIRREALDWAAQLEKKGKKVHLLGFFNTPKPPTETPAFDWFFGKETAFNYHPKSAKAIAFAKEKFDLLINLNFGDLPALAWVGAQSQAAMKIGRATEYPNDLDLQLDLPTDRGVKQFSEQLQPYLDTLVVATAKK